MRNFRSLNHQVRQYGKGKGMATVANTMQMSFGLVTSFAEQNLSCDRIICNAKAAPGAGPTAKPKTAPVNQTAICTNR